MFGDQRAFGSGSLQPESSDARRPRVGITRGGLDYHDRGDDDGDDRELYEDARESADGKGVAGDDAQSDIESTDAGDSDGQYTKVKVIGHRPEGAIRSETSHYLLDWGKRYVEKERYQLQVGNHVGVGLQNNYWDMVEEREGTQEQQSNDRGKGKERAE